MMDQDIYQMSRDQLIAEIKKLRAGIRTHRDSSEHELCWYHPALWGLLPEKTNPQLVVPQWPEFMQCCIRYRQSLDKQDSAKQAPAAIDGGNADFARSKNLPRAGRPYVDPDAD
jgi:hypothetical protein